MKLHFVALSFFFCLASLNHTNYVGFSPLAVLLPTVILVCTATYSVCQLTPHEQQNKLCLQYKHTYSNLAIYSCLQRCFSNLLNFLYLLFSFAFRWKPENVDGMPNLQTIHCWLGSIRASCSTEWMPGITVFVLKDAKWQTFGHWQLECSHVRHHFKLLHNKS